MLTKKTTTKPGGPIPDWHADPDVLAIQVAVADEIASKPGLEAEARKATDRERVAKDKLEAAFPLAVVGDAAKRAAGEKVVADARRVVAEAKTDRERVEASLAEHAARVRSLQTAAANAEVAAKKKYGDQFAHEFNAALDAFEDSLRASVVAMARAVVVRDAILEQYLEPGDYFVTWAPFNRIGMSGLTGFNTTENNRYFLLGDLEKLVKSYRDRGHAL